MVLFILLMLIASLPAQAGTDWYLHGTGGGNDNPSMLVLDQSPPTSSVTKYKESGAINFSRENTWEEIGIWRVAPAAQAQTLTAAGDLAVWVGTKNGDDLNDTQFDIRAELYKNNALLSSGQILCVAAPGRQKDDDGARPIMVAFGNLSNGAMAAGDVISLRMSARIGTNRDGTKCAEHPRAIRVRVYFDSLSRRSAVNLTVFSDRTPPAITATVSPVPNANGWNQTNVTVTFVCSDGDSGIASCPSPVSVSSEGASQVISRIAMDNAGNTATASVTLNIDKTPPGITAGTSPRDSINGWFSTDVTVMFSCEDKLSGIQVCPLPVTVTSDGPDQRVSATATDQAGNTAAASVSVSISRSPPDITASASPPANMNGWNNNAVAVTFTCSDVIFGISQCAGPVTLDTDSIKTEIITGRATSNSGLTRTISVTIRIDKILPSVEITVPMNGATVSTPSTTVSGTVLDSGSGIAGVFCNGNPGTITGSTFTCQVTLVAGTNVLSVQAADVAGNRRSTSVTINMNPAPPYVPGSILWMNVVGAAVSGNDLTKTATLATFSAGASSKNVIRDGYGFVEFTAPESNTERMAGLSNGDSNQSSADIDFGIVLHSNGTVGISEGGLNRGTFGLYSAGDLFRVEVRYGVVRYLRNGAALFTSSSIPRYPLRVDTSFLTTGARLSGFHVGNFVWTGATGVAVSRRSVTKTAATGWNAGAISTNTIESGDGFAEFTAMETNTLRVVGLANGDSSLGPEDIEFGIQLRADSNVEVMESGISQGPFGAYLPGDRFRVEVTGGVVRYLRNGIVFYASSVSPSYPLRVDSSFYSEGATLTDVLLETIVWGNADRVIVYGADLIKAAEDGWTAMASSTNALASGDCWIEFKSIETDTIRIAGLKSGNGAHAYTGIDFAIQLLADATVQLVESGTVRGQFGAYAPGDRFRIEIQDGIVRYRRNSTILYTSAVSPGYPLHAEAWLYTSGATIADFGMGDLTWINETRVEVYGQNIQANASVSGWDAGAVSTRQISSGYVEFTATDSSASRAVGLSHGDTGQDYADIDYAISLRPPGEVRIFESGVQRGASWGTFTAGDRLRIELQNNVVKYYRNGSLLYTSAVAPLLPLRVDSAFAGNGGSAFNVVLSGNSIIGQLDVPTIAPAGGQYSSPQTVTISHWLSGVVIRYTTDGTDPTESSPLYSGPIAVDQPTTVKARAWKSVFTPSAVRTAGYTFKATTPLFSVGSGTYNTQRIVTITTTTPGATIRYTIDGSAPTSSSTLYSSSVIVDQTLTLRAIASRTAWIDSNIAVATYTMKVGAPTLSPSFGSYNGMQTITFSSATPSVTYRYTADGAETGLTSPTVMGNSIVLDRSVTLKVQAFRTGWTTSDIARGNYFINIGTAGAPAFDPPAGTYASQRTIAISTTTSAATIRYTTDGTDPHTNSRTYTTPIPIFNTTEIRAKAYKSDYTASATVAAIYVIDSGGVDTPRASPGSGAYPTSKTVTITTQTSGATIHYTMNGSDPTESDPTVTSGGTVIVDRSMTLKLKAWKTGLPPSAISRADYQITGAVAAGQRHSLAVKADGTVWTWGSDQFGATGRPPDGATQTTPGQVAITDVVAVAGGADFSFALKKDGTVWSWGYGYQGQLGGGASSVGVRWAPGPVLNLTNVVSIAAGSYFGIAAKSDGTVWMWGNMNGINYGSVPVQIPGLKGVVQVAAGDFSVVALKTDGGQAGTVWSWGDNNWSELGDGTSTDRNDPVQAIGMTDAIYIGSGTDHTFASRSDGAVWAWGRNAWGQLGNGTFAFVVPPPTVASFMPVLPNTAPPLAGGNQFSLVLQRPSWRSERRIMAAGVNTSGQLGTGNLTSAEATPVFSLMTGAVGVAASSIGGHSLAIHQDGSVWTWGDNSTGQLGNGNTSARATPARIAGFVLADNSWVTGDVDGDGLSNGIEMELGTDPANSDTNSDGIPDNVSLDAGLDPVNLDLDFDGLANAKEREIGTDPFIADTDADGASDGSDCFPLETTRAQCPAPISGDVTPPSITLQEPMNAILVGSTP
jgi:alpha-tubulin suppressor-like RCC1 family protein